MGNKRLTEQITLNITPNLQIVIKTKELPDPIKWVPVPIREVPDRHALAQAKP